MDHTCVGVSYMLCKNSSELLFPLLRVDKKRDKIERKILDSQERAFWDVHRPVVSEITDVVFIVTFAVTNIIAVVINVILIVPAKSKSELYWKNNFTLTPLRSTPHTEWKEQLRTVDMINHLWSLDYSTHFTGCREASSCVRKKQCFENVAVTNTS